ncbi:MAG: D-glycerate dehydrogenase [Deltaproteobacteria bacterium]|nr:D-glycerate dehydrogenase [Deltaproteobacteria bacterium]
MVTAPLPGPWVPWLAERHEVLVFPNPAGPARPELLAWAAANRDAAALLALLTVRVDEALLGVLPSLRVVANYAVGVDNVDLTACAARAVVVCNTPEVLTDATADLTWALLLACARRVTEGERFLRDGRWEAFCPTLLLGVPVAGATLGIVGLGRIGRAVARRARGFGMRVLYASPRDAGDPEARRVPLEELLASADFVSLHCPLNDRTRGLLDAQRLALLRPHAVLVNTARGPLVDEAALAEALHAGRLGGAALDVYTDEPRIPQRLLTAPNTVLLPHLGSASRAAREAMARLAVEGIATALAGGAPANRV